MKFIGGPLDGQVKEVNPGFSEYVYPAWQPAEAVALSEADVAFYHANGFVWSPHDSAFVGHRYVPKGSLMLYRGVSVS